MQTALSSFPQFSYALGTVFTIDKTLRLGVFALGSCPEGAVSLIWTHILGGNLALALLISCGEAILSFGKPLELSEGHTHKEAIHCVTLCFTHLKLIQFNSTQLDFCVESLALVYAK